MGLKTSAIDAYEKMELSALKQMNVHIQLTARGLHNKPDSEPDIKPENDVQNSANSFKP
ncbi:hypothetical protein [uncultured Legionella sp.]|uniref:hypothetical protein n=1 Tax=uncultured Legionella sp. TaxID=210934 RepID=UPI00261BBB5F|nr:hypothetical protein [uncultured Legionella sp.]